MHMSAFGGRADIKGEILMMFAPSAFVVCSRIEKEMRSAGYDCL